MIIADRLPIRPAAAEPALNDPDPELSSSNSVTPRYVSAKKGGSL